MNKHTSTTSSRQLCDTTTSSQHPVTQPVTQQASNQQVSTNSVLSKLVTAGARAGACAYARTREGDVIAHHFGDVNEMCAYARTREGDGPEGIITPDDLMAIRDAYVAYVGQPMTAMVAREVEAALADGMHPSIVIEAAKVTGDAPRPTPYYMRAVLRRWLRDGVLTDDALAADRAAYEQQRAAKSSDDWWRNNPNPALRYPQRPLSEIDEESLFTDLSAIREEEGRG